MSDVIGRSIIEVGGDSSQFDAAMAKAEQSADKFEKGAVDSANKVGEAFERSANATKSASDRFVSSVEREIATLTLSRSEYRQWEAQTKGISESVYAPLIDRLAQAKKSIEDNARAQEAAAESARRLAAAEREADKARATQDSFLAGLREQIALYGRTSDEVLKYRAAQAGVLQQASPLITQLQNQRAAQEAAAEAAKKEAQAQREAADAKRTRDSFVQQLKEQSDAIGKTRSQLLELKAAELGVSAQAAPFIAKLREQEAALSRGGNALNAYGMTAKQTTAALRQVPAQITDIFVSLAGGQAPLTVLLQQGGQLNDVFGGVRPAAEALGGALLKLVNPYTLVAAGVAALIYGYARGSAEADKYRLAIVGTGNAAGTTVGQLGDYARAVSDVVGTQAKAAETLAAFVATGRVARDQLVQFSTTAIEVERATGKAVADTVKEYAELGKDPVEASRKLNESQNFLTVGILEQIKALKEQGRTQEAATLAQVTYDRELKSRAAGIVENIGLFEKAWRGVKDATLGAIDALGNVGRAQSNAEKLAQARIALANVEARVADVRSGKTFAFEGGKALAERDLQAAQQRVRDLEREEIDARVRAANRGTFARTQAEGLDAEKRLSQQRAESASNQEKLNKALKEYRLDLEKVRAANPNSPLLDPARIAKDEANIRERFKDPKGAQPKAFTDDEATRQLQRLRETEATLRDQLGSSEKLLASQKELARFEQLIGDLKEKKTLTADQESVLAAEDAIRAQLKTNVEIERSVKLKDDFLKKQEAIREAEEKFAERASQIRQSIASAQEAQRQQYDDRLGVVGLGSQAREELQAQLQIRRQYQQFQAQLTRGTPKELLGSEAYRKEVDDIEAAMNSALAASASYFGRLKVLQEDWTTGARASLIDYIDGTRDVAAQVYNVFGRTFSGLEDAVVQFGTTGKAAFKDLVNSILADLLRIAARRTVVAPLADALLGSLGGGSTLGSIIGAITGSGGGSGTSPTGGTGITLGGVSAGRAEGGSANAYAIHPVVERKEPEVLRTRRGTYLINGADSGQITPLRRLDGSAGGSAESAVAPVWQVIVQGAPSEPTTSVTPNGNGGGRVLIAFKAAVKAEMKSDLLRDLAEGGQFSRAINASTNTFRPTVANN